MKTKEFKGIISRNTAKDNSLILNDIEYSCIPFNSWFETHSRLYENRKSGRIKFGRIFLILWGG